jgi:hypothetical protein
MEIKPSSPDAHNQPAVYEHAETSQGSGSRNQERIHNTSVSLNPLLRRTQTERVHHTSSR